MDRLSALFFASLVLALTACKPSTEEESTPKTSAEAPASKPNEPTAVASSKETDPRRFSELDRILGSRAEGWSPKVIAAFKEGMTPEEAEKVMAGAGRINEFGISRVKVTGVPLVVKYQFNYLPRQKNGPKDRLYSVTIHFDPALNEDKEFYDALVKATTAKYGSVKPKDIEKKTLIWFGPDSESAQLSKMPGEWDGYQLKITPPRE